MVNTKIRNIYARQVLDSRGNFTIEVTLETPGHRASYAVPAGASVGVHEAAVTDVDSAAKAVNGEITKALVGMDVADQARIDKRLCELDGTENKSRLGTQAMLGTSIAAAKVAARAHGKELYKYLKTLASGIAASRPSPYLFINLINGGMHSKSPLAFQ